VLNIAQDEIGAKLPLINGIWPTGSLEAARLRAWRRKAARPRSWCSRRAPFTLGQSRKWRSRIFKRIADATDLPLIVFQYPLATGQGYPKDTLPIQSLMARTVAPPRPQASAGVLRIALAGRERILEHD